MFLKSDLYERNGKSVTLFELSALQRIEHLEHLKKIEAIEEGDIQAAMTTTVREGAFIVAMSLWHGHGLKGTLPEGAVREVEQIQEEVLATWPLEAVAEAEFRIRLLSGMLPPPDETSDPDAGEEPGPVTAEKPSPAS
ncbi:TPA: phage minor tail protein G [Citrobacter koseri]|uniref:Phage minor tail protein G n=1 Tax=Citrobacter koseri TaxID=545 RepID=A0AAQ0V717_CITKO|nr:MULTISPECIES: phage minor tail protein G [Citrobacter]OFV11206.1 phage tail protein [Salmonella sp. HMSC13B08]DAU76022.1 MAG TPA: tail assembly chaperone [Caudoviricetes sp.]ASE83935.1 phage minor tail protein G [Citrobacter koseri]ATF98186.1 phage minor tail protein G [Citrobacter koseri]AVE69406.1 phage minor tail protein G [Citrobacter koseri]